MENLINPLIYEAIANVMSEIGAVGKNSKNLQQGFMFRGIDAVMNAINPALVKHKVFVVPSILEQTREERTTAKGATLIYSICKVKYTFFATDGSSVEATVIGEGMDSGDKATNKAMSIAFKYACFQVFCIPTEEMKDPDEDTLEPSKPNRKTSSRTTKPKQDTNTESTPATDKSNIIDKAKIASLEAMLKKTNTGAKNMFEFYRVNSAEELNLEQYMDAMNRLESVFEKQQGGK